MREMRGGALDDVLSSGGLRAAGGGSWRLNETRRRRRRVSESRREREEERERLTVREPGLNEDFLDSSDSFVELRDERRKVSDA